MVAVVGGVKERRDTAERHADEYKSIQPKALDETGEIAAVGVEAVIQFLRPLGLPVTAQIGRQAVVIAAQYGAQEIPGVRVQSATMHEHHRYLSGCSPVEIVPSQSIDRHVTRRRQRHIGSRHAGNLHRQFQVLQFLRRIERPHSRLRLH